MKHITLFHHELVDPHPEIKTALFIFSFKINKIEDKLRRDF
jgi:hypothetical protein